MVIGVTIATYNVYFINEIRTEAELTRFSINSWAIDGNLSRAKTLHFPGSDHFYFTSHYLKLWDMYKHLGVNILQFSDTGKTCPSIESTQCAFEITHKTRATTAFVDNTEILPLGSTIYLCRDNNSAWVSQNTNEKHIHQNSIWIDRTKLPEGFNQFIVTKNEEVVCKGDLNWRLKRSKIWDHEYTVPLDELKKRGNSQ